MRQMTITLLTCAALSGTATLVADENAAPQAEASERAQVTKFLKKHVIGKTAATKKMTIKTDNNQMETDHEDLTTFNNFTETAEGFSFDITTLSKETRYELDKKGKRLPPGRDLSGTEVYRFELCERASTKRLTGSARLLSKTIKSPSREGNVILVTGMTVADAKLSWNETLPGYWDFIASKGKYKPGSWDGKYRFSLVGGKLRTEYEQTNFAVDPETLRRTRTRENPLLFVSEEIDQK